jgi:hypothetical protein
MLRRTGYEQQDGNVFGSSIQLATWSLLRGLNKVPAFKDISTGRFWDSKADI